MALKQNLVACLLGALGTLCIAADQGEVVPLGHLLIHGYNGKAFAEGELIVTSPEDLAQYQHETRNEIQIQCVQETKQCTAAIATYMVKIHSFIVELRHWSVIDWTDKKLTAIDQSDCRTATLTVDWGRGTQEVSEITRLGGATDASRCFKGDLPQPIVKKLVDEVRRK